MKLPGKPHPLSRGIHFINGIPISHRTLVLMFGDISHLMHHDWNTCAICERSRSRFEAGLVPGKKRHEVSE